ncbi:translation elongation factor-like protein [Patescibacteria group bacterium]|nr:translation elongation factor-like protein [Patescibacteria group bacterium]
MQEKKIGTITHFFDQIRVGIIMLDEELKIGDKVKFQGSTTNFEQEITEMQYDRQNIEKGDKGQEVGVKTIEKVRVGDEVYLIE